MTPWVLLVEDSIADRELLQEAWRRSGVGARLETAGDGCEAYDRLERLVDQRRELPVVVLTDLKMPRMDGAELLRRVRDLKGTRTLPVVVLSSSQEPEDVHRCYRLGANGFVVKPASGRLGSDALNALATFWVEVNRRPDEVA